MKRLFFALALCAASGACMAGGDMRFYEARSDKIRFTGRAAENGDGSLSFDWSGCHFTFRFDGSRCAMRAADTGRNYYNVFVDGRLYGKATVEGASSCVPLAEGLAPGPHTVTVQKRTEAEQGRTTLYGIEADGALLDLPPAPSRSLSPPRPRTATWHGAASWRAVSMPITCSRPIRGRALSVTGAT